MQLFQTEQPYWASATAGPWRRNPLWKGRGFLFKRFADIDVFDIELDTEDPQKIIDIVKTMEPTFGGINLEDIKAPECFEIERELKQLCDIPVFHDDQHGTAIICTAGVMNACEIIGKKLEDIKVVFNGAGAAGISCARMFISAGVKKENLLMCDSRGVIRADRGDRLSPQKAEFAAVTDAETLADAMKGADVFVGLSAEDVVSPDMLLSMAE